MSVNLPKRLWLFIIAMALIKTFIATHLALGNDEVYYWTYALTPEWNYFDHPPFIAWLIRLTTANLYFHNELATRLGAIVSSSLCTLIVFCIGKLLKNERVGWYAVLLYTASFYCSIIAGTFILPDSPQMVFWLGAIYLILRISTAIDQENKTLRLWIMFGLIAGCCMLCKVHGAFIWVGLLLFALTKQPRIFAGKGLYIAMAISLFLFSPVIIWNFQNHFITYTYHSDRVSLLHAGINPLSFFRELSGEFFYTNPVVFVLSWFTVFNLLKKKRYVSKNESILLFTGIPLIATLVLLSAFRDTLPHWSGPAYASLLFLVAIKLDSWPVTKSAKWLRSAFFFFLFIALSGLVMVNCYPGTLSPEKRNLFLGHGDPTLDLYGWRQTGKIIDSVYRTDQDKGQTNISFIAIDKWFPAGHLDFYVGQEVKLNTYGIGEIFDLHQYYWSNRSKKAPAKGENAYYIIPSNLFDPEGLAKMKTHFSSISTPVVVPIYRNGQICKNVLLFRLYGYKG